MQRTNRCIMRVLSAWDRDHRRIISSVERGEGERKGGKEGKKKRTKKREGKSEEKKMSRESDHAPRLGKLVDSPSSFERRKRLLRLKKN